MQRLKTLRRTLRLTQRQLAYEFKVTGAAIAQWETGKRPTPGPVIKLLEVYEESLGNTLNGEEKNQIRRLSSSWSDRILSLLKHKNSGDDFSLFRQRLQHAVKSYLSNELPDGAIAKRIRIVLLERVINSIGLAKGLPMKALQLLTYLDHGLSDETRNMILDLHFKAAPMAGTIAARIVHEELGRSPKQIFAKWNPRPFAIASIGQVHEATLHSGERVAVKIQYPEILKSINSDMTVLSLLSEIAMILKPDNRPIMKEIRDAIILECDYRNEALNQEAFRKIFQDDPHILIPKVHMDLSSQRVLTTEFVNGEKMREFVSHASSRDKNRAAEIIWKFYLLAPFRHSIMHGDPQADNLLFLDGRVAFLDFGRVIRFDPELMENHRKMLVAIVKNDRESARELVKNFDFIRNFDEFDFDEFWKLQRVQQAHLHAGRPFLMTRESIARSQKAARHYPNKKNIRISTDVFWSACLCYGGWALLADLGAKAHWGELALELIEENKSGFLS